MNKKIKYGFTLAEVLIVLAIIGVVAALTIPMLMSNYQKTQQVTALKKVYSQISEAVERSMNDYNVENFNDISLLVGPDADGKAFFKKYFKVSKYCSIGDSDPCFHRVTALDKSSTNSNSANGYTCVVVKDGASICIYTPTDSSGIVKFLVDTNGLDKPNTSGRDVFAFNVYSDGSVDELSPDNRDANDAARDQTKDRCANSNYGSGCFTKIFDAGWKMDY